MGQNHLGLGVAQFVQRGYFRLLSDDDCHRRAGEMANTSRYKTRILRQLHLSLIRRGKHVTLGARLELEPQSLAASKVQPHLDVRTLGFKFAGNLPERIGQRCRGVNRNGSFVVACSAASG